MYHTVEHCTKYNSLSLHNWKKLYQFQFLLKNHSGYYKSKLRKSRREKNAHTFPVRVIFNIVVRLWPMWVTSGSWWWIQSADSSWSWAFFKHFANMANCTVIRTVCFHLEQCKLTKHNASALYTAATKSTSSTLTIIRKSLKIKCHYINLRWAYIYKHCPVLVASSQKG